MSFQITAEGTVAEDQITRVFNVRFPREAVSDPLIYNVGQMFKVVTVIRAATINDRDCLMALELRGAKSEIEKAVKYFTDHRVSVEPLVEK